MKKKHSKREQAEAAKNSVGVDDKELNKDEAVSGDGVPPEKTDHQEVAKRPILVRWTKVFKKKRVFIPIAAVFGLLAVVTVVPLLRQSVFGQFLKASTTLVVTDSVSQKPVTDAKITFRGAVASTDSSGVATITGKLGKAKLTIEKPYYETVTTDLTLDIVGGTSKKEVSIKATGRQVPVKVVNRISGDPVPKVTISALGTEATTDDMGLAVIVLPISDLPQEATFTADGFNLLTQDILNVEKQVPENTIQITPSGKVYFLSKQSGKIDLVKTNLDGSDRQVVLAGTGNEDNNSTFLYNSPDRKFSVLSAQRDAKAGKDNKLYIIDTADDSLYTFDEGSDVTFNVQGWYKGSLVYLVNRNAKGYWQAKGRALKAYEPVSKKITSLYETTGEGTSSANYFVTAIDDVTFLQSGIVYSVNWRINDESGQGFANDKKASMILVQPDGSGRKTIDEASVNVYNGYYFYSRSASTYTTVVKLDIDTLVYSMNGVQDAPRIKKIEGGKLADAPQFNEDDFYSDVYDFVEPQAFSSESPDGTLRLWSEQRDGRTAVIVGDQNHQNPKTLVSFEKMSVIGWYGNDYILLSGEANMLSVMARKEGATPINIAPQHSAL